MASDGDLNKGWLDETIPFVAPGGELGRARLIVRPHVPGAAKHPLDQCRECGSKISAPSFGIGRTCGVCGKVARLEGDEDVRPRRIVEMPDGTRHEA